MTESLSFKEKSAFEKKSDFRVAIFGSGSESSEDDKQAMNYAKEISGSLIEQGFSIATGGYDNGVMKAANEGALEKINSKENLGDEKELIKHFPFSKEATETGVFGKSINDGEVTDSNSLTERLGHLINESNAFVVTAGKFGTIIELLVAIHSQNLNGLVENENTNKPIIVVDSSFSHLGTLVALVDSDPKLLKMHGIKDLYFSGGDEDWEKTTSEIIEKYYKQAAGEKLNEAETKSLSEKNFKYNYENWLTNAALAKHSLDKWLPGRGF